MGHPYQKKFYSERSRNTSYAAEHILRIVSSRIGSIDSMLDVGCGTGTWLDQALKMGASRAVGVEGEWVSGLQLDSRDIEVSFADLEAYHLDLRQKFSLAISLEVAEHLSAGRGQRLVAELCAVSDRVLFSAAIPGQGGKGHLNEAWQSHWVRTFEAQGFFAEDVVRPAIWDDQNIPAWYRQNILLYSNAKVHERAGDYFSADIVHPDYWNKANNPGIKQKLRNLRSLPGDLMKRFNRNKLGPNEELR